MSVLVAFLALIPSTPAPLAVEGGTVDIWLTDGHDESKRLSQQLSIQFSPGPGSHPLQIQVDANQTYQEMDGFGAALTDSAAWVITNTLEPTRTHLLNDLFSTTSGIGMSYLRLPMGSSEFVKDDWYTYDDMPPGQTDPTLNHFSIAHDLAYIIPVLHQATSINPQIKVMGSPWSAPAWMKSPETLTGGSLKPEFYEVYANYFVSFTLSYSDAGIPIQAVTVQNEPYYTSTTYPTMWMEPEDQAEFIKNHLGPRFAQHEIDTKILIWDHNWDHYDYPLVVLSDSDARAYIAGTAWHSYCDPASPSCTPEAQCLVHGAYPDKDAYFTESSGNRYISQGFAGDLVWGLQNVAIGATRCWARTILYWNLLLDDESGSGPHKGGCDACRGLVTRYPDGTTVYEAEYYVIGHLSKFVEPGAYRIESDDPSGTLGNVAFLNHDSIVLIVLNPEDAIRSFDVEWYGQHFAYSLPAHSVATFKWPAYRVHLPLILKAHNRPQSWQDFEPNNGTCGPYFEDIWHMPCTFEYNIVCQGDRSIRCEARAEADGTGGHGGTVAIYPSSCMPVDLASTETISAWVYDTQNNNTVELRLCDNSGCSNNVWSEAQAVENTWTEVSWALSDFVGVDKSQIRSIQIYEWNDGIYYFDQVSWH
jgi:glucosylceramidase